MFKGTKISKLLLSLVMGAMVFTGCGNKAATTTANNDSTKKDKVIRVGTSGEYLPWTFKEGGELKGFEIDVWNEIGKRTGYKVEFKVSKFSGLFGMLDAGQIDTIAHQISTTPQRKEKYDFTETYAYSGYSFAVKKDSSYNKVEDLKGKKIGVSLGGNGEKSIKDMNQQKGLNLDIITYDTVAVEKDAEIGRVDASFLGTVKAKSAIEKGNMNLRLIDSQFVYEINQYPFKKDENKEVIEAVNKAIKAMHEDGTLSKLSQKWFGLDTTKKQ
ncbi:transporter substrate-binding domain-containing protein [Clostridium sp. CX1]|uniref:transporter substrate-binding domain-containing protein n=1 Tax=Clostridium sp. CX1 TaxID=2978346 RepID=UPI0021BE1608|nr:transporter substrate-binding domain-containing protein [Clostridium sp. CX1]MCT8977779.1 transporter substrate-binding domain-containing protein [Clostridium sp. CX1]